MNSNSGSTSQQPTTKSIGKSLKKRFQKRPLPSLISKEEQDAIVELQAWAEKYHIQIMQGNTTGKDSVTINTAPKGTLHSRAKLYDIGATITLNPPQEESKAYFALSGAAKITSVMRLYEFGSDVSFYQTKEQELKSDPEYWDVLHNESERQYAKAHATCRRSQQSWPSILNNVVFSVKHYQPNQLPVRQPTTEVAMTILSALSEQYNEDPEGVEFTLYRMDPDPKRSFSSTFKYLEGEHPR